MLRMPKDGPEHKTTEKLPEGEAMPPTTRPPSLAQEMYHWCLSVAENQKSPDFTELKLLFQMESPKHVRTGVRPAENESVVKGSLISDLRNNRRYRERRKQEFHDQVPDILANIREKWDYEHLKPNRKGSTSGTFFCLTKPSLIRFSLYHKTNAVCFLFERHTSLCTEKGELPPLVVMLHDKQICSHQFERRLGSIKGNRHQRQQADIHGSQDYLFRSQPHTETKQYARIIFFSQPPN
ncbi:nck-associated protein 1 [Platysternon megacephalum]|uniref:Nck-associated protein 1 n=1 Tax=Platysternon megacephalum TaxID=55544 RepID=A0A4D9ETF1_9SAUR|nr:nck-associated protein 1 [Platysternon megacephalum]